MVLNSTATSVQNRSGKARRITLMFRYRALISLFLNPFREYGSSAVSSRYKSGLVSS